MLKYTVCCFFYRKMETLLTSGNSSALLQEFVENKPAAAPKCNKSCMTSLQRLFQQVGMKLNLAWSILVV